MTIHTVQLTDGTVGKVIEIAPNYLSIGDLVAVYLHDQNGMPFAVIGRIDFFLDESEL
jgi:hypothetical protein